MFVTEAIDTATRIIAARAQQRGITVHVDDLSGLPRIEADRRMVRQILLNLLSNAVKFTPHGGEVFVGGTADSGAVTITVRDTGIGMGEADIPRAMRAFVQLDNHLTRQHEGTGLGLSLVASQVKMNGGEFRITSALGEGTCAEVRLPVVG
jgi:signal transduction histidine kinase